MPKKDHAKWPQTRIDELRRRVAAGQTRTQIGKEMGTSRQNIVNMIAKYCRKVEGGRGENERNDPLGAPPSVDDIGVLQHGIDGELELSREDRPATVEELREMGAVAPEYVAHEPVVGQWNMAYKLKNFVPRAMMRRLVEIVRGGGGERECYEELDVSQTGHRKVKLYTTKVKFRPPMPKIGQDALKSWVDRHAKRPLPKKTWKPRGKVGLAVNWGYYDTHIGMYSWAKETGADWDVDIAVTRVLNSVDEMVERLKMLPSIGELYMPIGNDLGHFDSVRQTTATGLHHLDVDTRFPRVFDAAVSAMAYQVERACEVADKVYLIWVPGNHDTSMSYGIFRALCMRYLNWPQVVVVEDAAERKYMHYHHCIIGFDHGKIKPEAYSQIIMRECRGHLDNAWYVEMNTGHTHEAKQQILKTSVPTNGVQVRTHPSLAEANSWHFGQGFLGAPRKSVEALYYTPEGRAGDFVVYASDERRTHKIDHFIGKQMSEAPCPTTTRTTQTRRRGLGT
jgi:hypothetical protein